MTDALWVLSWVVAMRGDPQDGSKWPVGRGMALLKNGSEQEGSLYEPLAISRFRVFELFMHDREAYVWDWAIAYALAAPRGCNGHTEKVPPTRKLLSLRNKINHHARRRAPSRLSFAARDHLSRMIAVTTPCDATRL